MEKYGLVALKDRHGGRGRGITIEMVWLEKGQKLHERRQKALAYKQEQSLKTRKTGQQRQETLKTHSPNERPAALMEIISPQDKGQWHRTMMAFRELLEKSQLETRHARACASVLGKHIRSKRKSYALALYSKLEGKLNDLRLPEYVTDLKALCAWFMAVLKNIFKPKPKRKRYPDYNEYLKAMIEKERELVLRKRGHREPTAAEAWAKWNEEKNQKPLEWYEV